MLLHLSDIHARPGQPLQQLAEEISETVAPVGTTSHLIVSGDLGYQGQNIELGTRFIRQLAEALRVPPSRVICCPGNHDIESHSVDGHSFKSYHRRVAELLQDASRADPAVPFVYDQDGFRFLTLNSAHLLDWRHGQIDIQALRRLPAANGDVVQIAVVHHHCIPYNIGDQSHISNAYDMLQQLEARGVQALLHGHRHMSMMLRVNSVRVVGVGSVNFPPEANINNQFNLIIPGQQILRYRYIGDMQAHTGLSGKWASEAVPW